MNTKKREEMLLHIIDRMEELALQIGNAVGNKEYHAKYAHVFRPIQKALRAVAYDEGHAGDIVAELESTEEQWEKLCRHVIRHEGQIKGELDKLLREDEEMKGLIGNARHQTRQLRQHLLFLRRHMANPAMVGKMKEVTKDGTFTGHLGKGLYQLEEMLGTLYRLVKGEEKGVQRICKKLKESIKNIDYHNRKLHARSDEIIETLK